MRISGLRAIVDPISSAQWIAVSTSLYLAHGLVADPSEHYSLSSLLHKYVRPSLLHGRVTKLTQTRRTFISFR